MSADTYYDQCMRAGNREPWKYWGRLNHNDTIHPHQVELDEQGNIKSMPPLRGKPCFGWPQTFIRHGAREQLRRTKDGLKTSTNHQCGRCPEPTWQSCKQVVNQRIHGNPGIRAAFLAWTAECNRKHGGQRIFVGETGKLWVAFKKAIAARGPFTSANDELLRKEAERRVLRQRETWRDQKRRQRDRLAAEQEEQRQIPSREFVQAALDERNKRAAQLAAAFSRSDLPRRFTKVLPGDRKKVAELTASAWLARLLLREAGRKTGNTIIAKTLMEWKHDQGVQFDTLKSRVEHDLARGDECERLGIWAPWPDGKPAVSMQDGPVSSFNASQSPADDEIDEEVLEALAAEG